MRGNHNAYDDGQIQRGLQDWHDAFQGRIIWKSLRLLDGNHGEFEISHLGIQECGDESCGHLLESVALCSRQTCSTAFVTASR